MDRETLPENRAVGEDRGKAAAGSQAGDRYDDGAALVPGQAVAAAQHRHRAERLQPPALALEPAPAPLDARPQGHAQPLLALVQALPELGQASHRALPAQPLA